MLRSSAIFGFGVVSLFLEVGKVGHESWLVEIVAFLGPGVV